MYKLLSKFCDKAWLYIVYAMGLVMAFVLAMNWNGWETPQKLICLLAVAIPMHVFEENTYPGGFFYMNNLTFGSMEPTVYPQNRLTNMITNLGAETVFILLTVNALKMEVAVTVVVIFFGMLPYVQAEEVFADYFNTKPPFSATGAKKAEFPDAFVLKGLLRYCAENPDAKVLVISDDSDWKKTLIDHKQIILVATLQDAWSLLWPQLEDKTEFVCQAETTEEDITDYGRDF